MACSSGKTFRALDATVCLASGPIVHAVICPCACQVHLSSMSDRLSAEVATVALRNSESRHQFSFICFPCSGTQLQRLRANDSLARKHILLHLVDLCSANFPSSPRV